MEKYSRASEIKIGQRWVAYGRAGGGCSDKIIRMIEVIGIIKVASDCVCCETKVLKHDFLSPGSIDNRLLKFQPENQAGVYCLLLGQDKPAS